MRLFAGLVRRLRRRLGPAGGGERRRTVRIPRELLMQVRPAGRNVRQMDGVNRGLSENISRTGVKVRAFRQIPVRADVELDMQESHDTPPIRASGEVIWAAPLNDEGHWVFGIAFSNLAPEDRERITALIEARQEAGPDPLSTRNPD